MFGKDGRYADLPYYPPASVKVAAWTDRGPLTVSLAPVVGITPKMKPRTPSLHSLPIEIGKLVTEAEHECAKIAKGLEDGAFGE